MIGDRADTDILMGNKANIATCLTMTGVIRSKEDMDEWAKKGIEYKATSYIHSFGVLD